MKEQLTWHAASVDPVVGVTEAVSNSDTSVISMWPVRNRTKF